MMYQLFKHIGYETTNEVELATILITHDHLYGCVCIHLKIILID